MASSVRWADEHERDQMNGAASSNDTQTDSTTNDVPFGAVNSQDASEKGREIEDLKAGQGKDYHLHIISARPVCR